MSPNVTDWLTGGRVRPLVTLGLLVAAVFGPVVGFDFVRWDDPVNVTQNPLITEPWSGALLAKILNGDTALRFKPLPWLIYRGLHAAFGFNPAAWHALSLGLHLGATLLFFAVLRELLARFRPGTALRPFGHGSRACCGSSLAHPSSGVRPCASIDS